MADTRAALLDAKAPATVSVPLAAKVEEAKVPSPSSSSPLTDEQMEKLTSDLNEESLAEREAKVAQAEAKVAQAEAILRGVKAGLEKKAASLVAQEEGLRQRRNKPRAANGHERKGSSDSDDSIPSESELSRLAPHLNREQISAWRKAAIASAHLLISATFLSTFTPVLFPIIRNPRGLGLLAAWLVTPVAINFKDFMVTMTADHPLKGLEVRGVQAWAMDAERAAIYGRDGGKALQDFNTTMAKRGEFENAATLRGLWERVKDELASLRDTALPAMLYYLVSEHLYEENESSHFHNLLNKNSILLGAIALFRGASLWARGDGAQFYGPNHPVFEAPYASTFFDDEPSLPNQLRQTAFRFLGPAGFFHFFNMAFRLLLVEQHWLDRDVRVLQDAGDRFPTLLALPLVAGGAASIGHDVLQAMVNSKFYFDRALSKMPIMQEILEHEKAQNHYQKLSEQQYVPAKSLSPDVEPSSAISAGASSVSNSKDGVVEPVTPAAQRSLTCGERLKTTGATAGLIGVAWLTAAGLLAFMRFFNSTDGVHQSEATYAGESVEAVTFIAVAMACAAYVRSLTRKVLQRGSAVRSLPADDQTRSLEAGLLDHDQKTEAKQRPDDVALESLSKAASAAPDSKASSASTALKLRCKPRCLDGFFDRCANKKATVPVAPAPAAPSSSPAAPGCVERVKRCFGRG